MYINRDKQVTLERELTALLQRVDVLRAAGIAFKSPQREALAWMVRNLREDLERLAQQAVQAAPQETT
jgi:hypothetical protein